MNKSIIVLSLVLLAFFSCTQNPSIDTTATSAALPLLTFPENIAKGTIYEVNIRQHTNGEP